MQTTTLTQTHLGPIGNPRYTVQLLHGKQVVQSFADLSHTEAVLIRYQLVKAIVAEIS